MGDPEKSGRVTQAFYENEKNGYRNAFKRIRSWKRTQVNFYNRSKRDLRKKCGMYFGRIIAISNGQLFLVKVHVPYRIGKEGSESFIRKCRWQRNVFED